MKPRFLGEGNAEQYSSPLYWQQRMEYWIKCAARASGFRKEIYLADALGYQMLLDGRAKQIGNGNVEYESEGI